MSTSDRRTSLPIIALTSRHKTASTMHFISKTETFVKLFFVLSLFGLVMYAVLAFYTFQTAFSSINKTERDKKKETTEVNVISEKVEDAIDRRYKYILLWTREDMPINWTEDGQMLLINNQCSYTNCYITTDKNYLNFNVKNFDAIVFSIRALSKWKKYMPQQRSPKQKYVFYSMTPASSNPVCDLLTDNFFNWTWSYRIMSDIMTPFIEVKDLNGNIVAPGQNTEWFDMTTLDTFRINNNTLPKKTKAVMYHTNNCEKNLQINDYIKKLTKALSEHQLELDVYDCNKKCPDNDCMATLDKNYYFYLAHESTISEDYVTTEVLKAYNNNAVPIVVGGADYSRFLPPGSFINTQRSQFEHVAAHIAYAIRTPTAYFKFFIWKQYYIIEEVKPQRGYCDLCELLNNKKRVTTPSVYAKFRNWWYPGSLNEKCLPKGSERIDEMLSYVNDRMPENKMKLYYGIT